MPDCRHAKRYSAIFRYFCGRPGGIRAASAQVRAGPWDPLARRFGGGQAGRQPHLRRAPPGGVEQDPLDLTAAGRRPRPISAFVPSSPSRWAARPTARRTSSKWASAQRVAGPRDLPTWLAASGGGLAPLGYGCSANRTILAVGARSGSYANRRLFPRAGVLDAATASATGPLDRRWSTIAPRQLIGNFQQASDDFDAMLAGMTTVKSRLDGVLWRYAAQVHTRQDARGVQQ